MGGSSNEFFSGLHMLTFLPNCLSRVSRTGLRHTLSCKPSATGCRLPFRTILQTFIPADTASGMHIVLLPAWVAHEDAGSIPWTVRAFHWYKVRVRELPNCGSFSHRVAHPPQLAQGAGFRGMILLTAASLDMAHGQ